MELKTRIEAEDNKQELLIHREFDLPVHLVFKAHTIPSLFEQWMGTSVVKFDFLPHGGYRFETKNPDGLVVFSANGVFHDTKENEYFTRTFEMENTGFSTQLEFYKFIKISETKSKLLIHIIYKSIEERNKILMMPFGEGINMAHNKLEMQMKN